MASTSSEKRVRTRQSSGTKPSDYLGGPGIDFTPSEVPTLRDVLFKGILIQENKMLMEGGERKSFPVKDMIRELASSIYCQWYKSNAKFSPSNSDSPGVVVC